MKKLSLLALTLLTLFFALFALIGCGSTSNQSSSPTTSNQSSNQNADDQSSNQTTTNSPAQNSQDATAIYMITDTGDINDHSFNEGTYEGIQAFDKKHPDIKYSYFKPTDKSPQAYQNAIETVISKGAKVVVTPGFLFQTPVFNVQDKYPNVKFVLIDGVPTNEDFTQTKIAKNTLAITFKEQEAGFLAGYAAVADGLTHLGFIGGMPVPAVVKFGSGYIYGAYLASHELSKPIEFLPSHFQYVGQFTPDPKFQQTATTWYTQNQNPVDVIFAAAGGVGNNIFDAAKSLTNKKAIGVDSDQMHLAPQVIITSAVKNLQLATEQALEAAFSSDPTAFKGGQHLVLGAAENMVGLAPTTQENWKLTNFSIDQYNKLYARLHDGSITVPTTAAELKAQLEAIQVPADQAKALSDKLEPQN